MKKPIWMAVGLTIIVVGGAFITWKIYQERSKPKDAGPGDETAVAQDLLKQWPKMKPEERSAALPGLVTALDACLANDAPLEKLEKPDRDRPLRVRAAFQLLLQRWKDMDPEARKATTPVLIRSLKVDDEDYRLTVALSAGRDAVPELIKAAGFSDPGIRYYAIWSLGRLGTESPEAIPVVTAALKDDSPEVRRKAIWALGQTQRKANVAVPLLADALADPDEEVRKSAADALASYGKSAVPVLTKGLQDDKLDQRRLAARAVARIGADASDTLTDLVPLLQPEMGMREEAASALAALGPVALPALTAAVKSDYSPTVNEVILGFGSMWALGAAWPNAPEQRRLAIGALARVGGPAVDTLIESLRDPSEDVRAQAAGTLRGLGFNDRRIVVALAERLRDSDESVRLQARHALRDLAPEARHVLPVLREAIQDESPDVRRDTALCLETLGTPALSLLVGALKDPDARVQSEAAKALQSLNVNNEVLLAAVLPLLEDKNVEVRKFTVAVMHRCGPAVVPLLLRALKDSDEGVRRQILLALNDNARPGDKATQQILIDTLKDNDPHVRSEAVTVLGRFGLAAVPVLIDAMNDPDPKVGTRAKDVLKTMNGDNRKLLPLITEAQKRDEKAIRQGATFVLMRFGPEGVPFLLAALKDKDEDVQYAAVYALDDIGIQARETFPQLANVAMDHPQKKVRAMALKAMLKMNAMDEFWENPEQAVPGLIELLGAERASARWQAATLLAVIGPDAEKAVPALTKALKDPRPEVGKAAEFALGRIRKKGD